MHIHLKNEPNVLDTQNPGITIPTRTQFPQNINIWARIFNNQITGAFEIERYLKADTYLDLLIAKGGPALDYVAREN